MSSKIFSGYSDHFDADVRLTILKAIDDETGKALNDNLLLATFEKFAIRRGREYLHNQLNWLEGTAGAVKLSRAGSVVIAQLTEKGADHLSRVNLIVGVKEPSLPR